MISQRGPAVLDQVAMQPVGRRTLSKGDEKRVAVRIGYLDPVDHDVSLHEPLSDYISKQH